MIFSDLVIENIGSGVAVVSLEGKVQVLNRSAKRILGIEKLSLKGSYEEVFAAYPQITQVLRHTLETGQVVNRKEMKVYTDKGEVLLGYGTSLLKDESGAPVGVSIIFQDITRFIPLPLTMQFMSLLNNFFTPFAVVLVLSALVFGYAESWQKTVSVVILAVTTAINYGTLHLVKRTPERAGAVGQIRVITNFTANTLLVYFLGTLWGPMWLLFILAPLATGLYGDIQATFITSMIAAATLLGVYWIRGLEGEVGWGQAAIHAIFIVFISLFTNRLAELVASIRSKQS